MLIDLLRFLRSFFGIVLAAVAGLATVVAACLVAALTYAYFNEGRLGENDIRLLTRAIPAVPVGALLTWAGARLANGRRRRWVPGQTRSFRLKRSPREQAVSRVCMTVLWVALVSIWSWTHLSDAPVGTRAGLTAGMLAFVFAAMHARVILHELAHLFAGRLCGLKPLAVRVGRGPRLWTGESRDGFRWEWRWWPSFGWVEMLHFDERSYRWRQFLTVAAGPLADALFVAGGWWLLTHPGREAAGRALLTSAGGLQPDGLLIVLAVYAVFAPSMLMGLLPVRATVDGRQFFSDGWWLLKLFFLPAATIRELFCGQKCTYAVRLWKSGHREASREQLAEAQALFPEREATLLLLECRLHRESGESGPAEECFQRALESSDALAPEARRNLLIGYAAGLAANGEPDGARQVADALLARSDTTAEKVAALDALACLPILHRGTSALLPDAERWCAEARALAPDEVTLRGTWGSLLVETNREEEAVPILEEVLAATRSDHDRGIGSFYLALAARRLGRRKEMLRHRRQTLRWCKEPVLLARIPAELPAT